MLAMRFQHTSRLALTLKEGQAGIQLRGVFTDMQGAVLCPGAPAGFGSHTILFKQNRNHLSKTVSSPS